MYKVYFNRNTVVFPARLSETPGTVTVLDPDPRTMQRLIADCYGKDNVNVAFFSPSGRDLQKIFDGFFRHIPAAGGIVRHRPTGRILMIRRWGKWDLPKGWQEKGESLHENALREVREETGLIQLEAAAQEIHTSRHAYLADGQWTVKHTHWFAMTTEQTQLHPQSEEDILSAEWLDSTALAQAMNDTYPNIRETLQTYLSQYPLP